MTNSVCKFQNKSKSTLPNLHGKLFNTRLRLKLMASPIPINKKDKKCKQDTIFLFLEKVSS